MILSFDTIGLPQERAQAEFDALLDHFPGLDFAIVQGMAISTALAVAEHMPDLLSFLAHEMPQLALMGQPGGA
jgi:hypothetical protein